MTNPDLRAAFAPTGKLRASINTGNAILAAADPAGAGAKGVSVDLARKLAGRLDVELELVIFKTARESVEAVAAGHADIGFFAVDPKRGEQIAFTPPYVHIEGTYLVRNDSPITHIDQIDRKDVRVTVGKGSAYDLFLTRELKQAMIEHAPSSPTVVDTFLATQADVAAGVRQQLEADAQRLGSLRVLEGHFMVIRQAMGMPKNSSPEAIAYLCDFVEEMKSDGTVQAALKTHQIQGVYVAPPAADAD
ncbi:transporter substrate-binding domain-containing protein [Allopusillimonas ginsengisoli]|uniref:transporter substrate-binding domain-containing protein n=1 Tax=Allopusillimonas ginsengisoli TaxID=453575 RepID=UPI0010C1DC81|nr:transporter substrate-binding domain-containing protein [Allopusillimonas ginsengisoli]